MPKYASHVESSARLRAALAYSGLTQQELADALRLPKRSLSLMASGSRQPGLEELYAAADACRVPRTFMRNGFEPPPTNSQRDGAIEEILRQIDNVRQLVDDQR